MSISDRSETLRSNITFSVLVILASTNLLAWWVILVTPNWVKDSAKCYARKISVSNRGDRLLTSAFGRNRTIFLVSKIRRDLLIYIQPLLVAFWRGREAEPMTEGRRGLSERSEFRNQPDEASLAGYPMDLATGRTWFWVLLHVTKGPRPPGRINCNIRNLLEEFWVGSNQI